MATLQTPQLERASFRGVLFTCTSHDVKAGRRTADHVFPKRDLGYREDMGRADREFTLTAYLNGDNVFDQRDRLLAALEAPGPGELFHPWLGRLMVVAKPSSVREARNARRQAELSLTFIEAGRASVNTGWRDTRAGLNTSLKKLTPACELSLSKNFSLARAASFVTADGINTMVEAAVGGEVVRGMLTGVREGFALMRSVDNMVSTARTLIKNPAAIVGAASGMMFQLAGASPDVRRIATGIDQTFRTFGDALSAIPLTTTNRLAQQLNRSALTRVTRVLALGAATSAASQIQHRDYDEAVTWRTRISDWCDDEIASASRARDDTISSAVRDLRTSYVDRVTEGMASLASVRSVSLPTVMPSLVAAHRLYGDARRAVDVADRNINSVVQGHPGFLPASQSIDVPSQRITWND